MRFVWILFTLLPFIAFNQTRKKKSSQILAKNNLFLSIGTTKTWYSKSDLRINDPAYQLTFQNIKATDGNRLIYFPADKSKYTRNTAQFHLQLGFSLNEHYASVISYNRFNYNLINNQRVLLSGSVNEGTDITGAFSGNYLNTPILVDSSHFNYQLNGISNIQLQVIRSDDFFPKGRKRKNLTLSGIYGIGGGVISSNSNVYLMGIRNYNIRSNSGFNLFVLSGLRLFFRNYFFIQSDVSAGFINQNKIVTGSKVTNSLAEQKMNFAQFHLSVGFVISSLSEEKCDCPTW